MKKTSLLLCFALVSSLTAAEPAHVELAHRAVVASQFEQGLEQLKGQIMMSVFQKLGISAPVTEPQDEPTKAVLAKVNAVVNEEFKGIIAKLDAAYAEVYSEKELLAVVAFYESPEGKSFLGKQPMLGQRVSPIMQTMRVDLNTKLTAIINEAKAAMPAPAAIPVPTPESAAAPTPAPQK